MYFPFLAIVLLLLAPVLLRQLVGALDVLLLGRLVATAQQHDHPWAVLQVVDAVTRPEPQPKLPDSLANGFGVARISGGQPVKSFDEPQLQA